MDNVCVVSDWKIPRILVESKINRKLTDKEWQEFYDEMVIKVDDYAGSLFDELVNNMEAIDE